MRNLEEDEQYIIIDGKNHLVIVFPEMQELFDYVHYADWQREFDKLVASNRAAYKEYRAAARDCLFL